MIKIFVLGDIMYVFFTEDSRKGAEKVFQEIRRCQKEGRTTEKVLAYNLDRISWARKVYERVVAECEKSQDCYELLPEHVVC